MKELTEIEREWMASHIARGLAFLDREVGPQEFEQTMRALESGARAFRTASGKVREVRVVVPGDDSMPAPSSSSLEDAVRASYGLAPRKEVQTRMTSNGVPAPPDLVAYIREQRDEEDKRRAHGRKQRYAGKRV